MRKNCIFVTVGYQEKYVDMLYLLLESLYLYGNLKNDVDILIYTSSIFKQKIQNSKYNSDKLQFEIKENVTNVDKACKMRLDIFKLESIKKYEKILYVDTDILIKNDINILFNLCTDDVLYAGKESKINKYCTNINGDYHGNTLFSKEEMEKFDGTDSFSSGIMLFKNCEAMKMLFEKINDDASKRHHPFFDQPFIVYNTLIFGKYDLKSISKYIKFGQTDENKKDGCVVCHYCGGVGEHGHKLNIMRTALDYLKRKN